MECSRIREILFENAGADIPVEVRDEVKAHLAGCKPCAAQAYALERQSQALGALPRMEAPPDLLAKIRQQVERPSILAVIREKLSGFFSGRYFFRFAGVAVTAVLVVAITRVILDEGGQSRARFSPPPPAAEAPALTQAAPPVPAPGDTVKEKALKGAMGGAAPSESASPPGMEASTAAPQKSAETSTNIPGAPEPKTTGGAGTGKMPEPSSPSLRAVAPRMESEYGKASGEKRDAAKLGKSAAPETSLKTQSAPGRAGSPAPPAAQAPAPAPIRAESSAPAGSGLKSDGMRRSAPSQSLPTSEMGANTVAGKQSIEITISFPGTPASKSGGTNAPEKMAESASPSSRALAPRMETKDFSAPMEKKAVPKLEDSQVQHTQLDIQRFLSDVKTVILRAKGEIVGERALDDKMLPNAMLIDIPAENYPAFSDQLHQLGKIRLDSKGNPSLTPGTMVRVTLHFAEFD